MAKIRKNGDFCVKRARRKKRRRERSNRFHVTSKTNHHVPSSCPDIFNAKGKQIMKPHHDCKWCYSCTRKQLKSKTTYLHPGYQNSVLCEHVMYTGIYNGGMIRASDEEDTLRVSKRRGAKKKTNCYFKPPNVPPPAKNSRMLFSMFR